MDLISLRASPQVIVLSDSEDDEAVSDLMAVDAAQRYLVPLLPPVNENAATLLNTNVDGKLGFQHQTIDISDDEDEIDDTQFIHDLLAGSGRGANPGPFNSDLPFGYIEMPPQNYMQDIYPNNNDYRTKLDHNKNLNFNFDSHFDKTLNHNSNHNGQDQLDYYSGDPFEALDLGATMNPSDLFGESPRPGSAQLQGQPPDRAQVINNVSQVFPEICQDYVSQLYDVCDGQSDRLMSAILDKLDKEGAYPKVKKPVLQKRKREVDEDEQAQKMYEAEDREEMFRGSSYGDLT
jgi:hypothetical protein